MSSGRYKWRPELWYRKRWAKIRADEAVLGKGRVLYNWPAVDCPAITSARYHSFLRYRRARLIHTKWKRW